MHTKFFATILIGDGALPGPLYLSCKDQCLKPNPVYHIDKNLVHQTCQLEMFVMYYSVIAQVSHATFVFDLRFPRPDTELRSLVTSVHTASKSALLVVPRLRCWQNELTSGQSTRYEAMSNEFADSHRNSASIVATMHVHDPVKSLCPNHSWSVYNVRREIAKLWLEKKTFDWIFTHSQHACGQR